MQLNQLNRKHRRIRSRSVGRGGRRGKTSGRGTKGQKARAGHKMRPEIRDIIKKLPRLRGRGKHPLKSIVASSAVIPISLIERHYASGETVSKKTMQEKKLIGKRVASVVIVGGGSLGKKLTVTDCRLSASARRAIEKAGGVIVAP